MLRLELASLCKDQFHSHSPDMGTRHLSPWNEDMWDVGNDCMPCLNKFSIQNSASSMSFVTLFEVLERWIIITAGTNRIASAL